MKLGRCKYYNIFIYVNIIILIFFKYFFYYNIQNVSSSEHVPLQELKGCLDQAVVTIVAVLNEIITRQVQV